MDRSLGPKCEIRESRGRAKSCTKPSKFPKLILYKYTYLDISFFSLNNIHAQCEPFKFELGGIYKVDKVYRIWKITKNNIVDKHSIE